MLQVVDIEKRIKLSPNQHGEICIKGPSIMKCYVGNEKATRDMIDEEGYLKTGDIGYYDTDGAFFIVDRLKELIKYKGFQVSVLSTFYYTEFRMLSSLSMIMYIEVY